MVPCCTRVSLLGAHSWVLQCPAAQTAHRLPACINVHASTLNNALTSTRVCSLHAFLLHACGSACTHARVCVNDCVCVCVRAFMILNTHVHVHTHTHACTCMHVCACMCTCTCTCACVYKYTPTAPLHRTASLVLSDTRTEQPHPKTSAPLALLVCDGPPGHQQRVEKDYTTGNRQC